MARIPRANEVLRPASVDSPRQIVRIDGSDFGATGRAVQGFAQSAMQAAGQFADTNKQASEYETARKFVELDIDLDRQFDEAKRNAPENPTGFTDGFKKNYDDAARNFFTSVPDALKPKYDQMLAQRGAQFEGKARDWEYQTSDQYHVTDLSKQLDGLSNISATKPDSYAENIGRGVSLIDAAPIPAAAKMKLREKFAQDSEMYAARGRLARGDRASDIIRDLYGSKEPPADTDLNPELRAKPLAGDVETPAQPRARTPISFRLETGETDPLKGVSNISGDSNGSHSYGNFGLNSQGSAQAFVRSHGKGLGLKGEPGTSEFDQSWKEAARRDPAALHQAEMAWHSKTITPRVVEGLSGAGVPEGIANDPRVQAYFSDRLVQYGPASLGNHKNRIAEAFSESGGDAAKFLKQMTEADRGNLRRDFPSALRTGVYSERGHNSRVDGRLKLALADDGGAPAQEQTIYDGPYRHLSADQRLDLVHTARAQARQEAAQVKEDVRSVESIAEKGFAPQPGQLDALRAKVEKTEDPEVHQAFRQAEATMQWQSAARQSTPDQLDSYVRQETERLKAGGATAFDVKRVEMADKLLTNMRQELKSDALGWADRVGLVKLEPIDFSSPEAAQASLTTRVKQGDIVAQKYGVEPKYLRPDEDTRLTAAMDAGGDRLLSVAGMVSTAAGEKAPSILREIFKKSPTAAIIGGLVTDTGVTAAAKDAADGIALSKQPDFQSVAPKSKDARLQISEVMGSALSGMPQTENAIISAANMVYEIRARKQGLTDFDGGIWQKGLLELVGERVEGDKTYGGVVDANPSYWGSRKIIIPPFLSQDNWRQAVDMLQPTDLDAAGLGTPAGGDGKAISMARAKGATLVQVGDGRYALSLGDPDTPGSEKWIVRQDNPNELFEIDFRKLRPALESRRPDLFFGGYTDKGYGP